VGIRTLSAITLIAAAAALSCHTNSRQRRFDLPGVVLWAWERPEDLRFLDPRRAGVAFVAATAAISGNGNVSLRPRTQSLLLPPNAAVLAVVHVDSALKHDLVQPRAFLSGLSSVAALPNLRGIQIDFEARKSERNFYSALLKSMPPEMRTPIGITALASWCTGDRWLDAEPIVEAVPMFFRMGKRVSRDAATHGAVCRSSIGLSTDEPWPAHRAAGIRRIYLFNPRAWTQADYLSALHRIEDWK
jgi:hypothetical protein